ncbi:putative two-component system response regulator [Rhodovulum bhavnagarense]|uniref:Putative two-component system response regulator n=1 Tax=Rhodovulum bhavnagarense TaxID=992286 RepID=A0A4R2RDS3_9RHOB|nr:HD domain-containing phosphohydrolase [Rhodovulum bhavnagarense]TCP60664.1 putative two-component system response regulator [Rhodovulum bhavnagarense]
MTQAKASILIVDDEPQNLYLLGELLSADYQVKVATSGSVALDIARTAPHPDLILLDVMMPQMDGHEVLHHLRESPETANIPVIFVTAKSQHIDEEAGLKMGAQDYIGKPIVPAVLTARVRAQLDLKAARDVLADQNEWLEREVARRMRENLLIQEVTISALATLAEARDKDTGLHILRTQSYVRLLADYLARMPEHRDELDPKHRELIVKASPLHDIGKVAISDKVLLKPGRLTPEEFEIIKTHSRIGSDAIEMAMDQARASAGLSEEQSRHALEFLAVAAEIAHFHHEKWDGSGYPDGLSGDQIPLSARMMAVADVFDALSSARVYKEAMPLEKVDEILLEGRGTHFDPDVIDAYVAMRDHFFEVAEKFSDPAPETT